VDVLTGDGNGENLRLQPSSAAVLARFLAHELLEPFLDTRRLRFKVASPQILKGAGEFGLVLEAARSRPVFVLYLHALVAAVHDHIHHFPRKLGKRRVEAELVVFRKRLEPACVPRTVRIVGNKPALVERKRRIRYQKGRIELQLCPKAGTARAGPERIVE